MLSSIRKFSSSIYAKILLCIIVIPFIFWGMGSTFTSGDKNIVVTIDKDKYTVQDFGNFIQGNINDNQKINEAKIEELLTLFVGEKLLSKEVDYFNVKLSDKSLSNLIKHQEEFKKDEIFSRTEYEKFLIKNNMSAVNFEHNIRKNERKKQLLNFIGGGVEPTKFLVNVEYNNINQKRHVEILNLNKYIKDDLIFTQDEIKKYYENNIDKFTKVFKTAKILELSPNKLIGKNEFNNTFFKKVDEIDDYINQENNLKDVSSRFNLGEVKSLTFNKSGEDLNSNKINELSEYLVKSVFNLEISSSTQLLENNNKFFIIELEKTENIKSNIEKTSTKKIISEQLNRSNKIRLLSDIISKINKNNFQKSDFNELSKRENIPIEKIIFQNINDDKRLNKELVLQIYNSPSKSIIPVHNIELTNNYLVYINKIENVTIKSKSDDYEKYLNLSKVRIASRLFNTYDNYIKKKYKIDINYRALDTVKNYFN